MSKHPQHPSPPKPSPRPAQHVFGRRPLQAAGLKTQQPPAETGDPFQPLPQPTRPDGTYRLDLADVIPDAVAAMTAAGRMVFHVAGDTGGIQDPRPQQLVAAGLNADAKIGAGAGAPAFFYILGDVIYFDGLATEWYPQFYLPYAGYPNPIFAIPGNHDGDVYDDGEKVATEPSLGAFVRNLCQASAGVHSPDAREEPRTAMIQPNVYWTLLCPFVTIIGLYSNVPEGGVVEPDQQAWFDGELKAADPDKPVFVAVHHPPHSLDDVHSGSSAMEAVIDAGIAASGRTPDLVLSGHVHTYQRYTQLRSNGVQLPFIVAGHGGYHNLYKVARMPNGGPIMTPYSPPGEAGITLENYQDTRWGFLRIEISGDTYVVDQYTVPLPTDPAPGAPTLADTLTYNWKTKQVVT